MSENPLFADLETGLKQAIDHATGKQKGKTTKLDENENIIDKIEFVEQEVEIHENEKLEA